MNDLQPIEKYVLANIAIFSASIIISYILLDENAVFGICPTWIILILVYGGMSVKKQNDKHRHE